MDTLRDKLELQSNWDSGNPAWKKMVMKKCFKKFFKIKKFLLLAIQVSKDHG